MNVDFSNEIDKIVEKLLERLKPFLANNGTARNEDIIFDLKGLCEYLSVSEQWVYNRVHLKEIPHLKIGGVLRFQKKQIDKWLNSFNVPAISDSKQIMKIIKGK